MIDEKMLRTWALELGFCEAALCSAEEFNDEQRLVACQKPLAERKQLRFAPCADDARIQSLCVLLWPYRAAKMPHGDEVFVDSYYFASNAAYHAARELENRLATAGHFARANVSYPAKRAAVRAGLGKFGRNGLLITPKYGTRVVIILMAVDIRQSDDQKNDVSREISCLECGRCSSVCPSGALSICGMEFPEKCLRNYTLEGTVVPAETRARLGNRLIGCDMCQRVCPMQPQSTAVPGEGPVFHLREYMTTDDNLFSQSVSRLAKEIGRNAARPQRIRAQAALIAGNMKAADYLPVLRKWSLSEFEAVRTHSLWAIERIEKAR